MLIRDGNAVLGRANTNVLGEGDSNPLTPYMRTKTSTKLHSRKKPIEVSSFSCKVREIG